MMDDAAAPRSSARNHSTNFISTLWRGPPRCTIRKPSRLSSCAPPAFTRSGFTSTTARRWQQYGYYNLEQIRQDQSYGTQSNPKVWVMEEFKNSEAEPSRHRAAQGQAAFLSSRHRRPPGICRRERDRSHAERRNHPHLHRQLVRRGRRAQAHQLSTWTPPSTGWMNRSKSACAITRKKR